MDINLIQFKIHNYRSNIWGREILDIPKLRTYNSFKPSFGIDSYKAMNMCKYFRVNSWTISMWNFASPN